MSLSVNRIGVTPNNVYSLKSNDINFQGKKSEINQSKDEGMGTFAKVMLGATALAATAAIYVATKGKVKAPLKPEVSTILPQNLSHLDIDLFKKYGKFENGKAIFNGKEFSGSIYTKNGGELTYSLGMLEKAKTPKATKYYYKGELCSADHNYQFVGNIKQTKIDRLKDGTRVITKRRGGFDNKFLDENLPADKNHDIITTIKPDGTITRLTKNLEQKDKLGKKFTYDKIENLKTGEISLTKKKVEKNEYFDFCPYSDIKRKVVIDGKKITQELNSEGKVIRQWTTEYNPKTGVSVQKIEYPPRPESTRYAVIMSDKKGNVLEHTPTGLYTLKGSKIDEIGRRMRPKDNPYSTMCDIEKVREAIKELKLPFEI